jgi:hypothetical protein
MGAALFSTGAGQGGADPCPGSPWSPATRIEVRLTKITNENLIGEEVTITA